MELAGASLIAVAPSIWARPTSNADDGSTLISVPVMPAGLFRSRDAYSAVRLRDWMSWRHRATSAATMSRGKPTPIK